MCEVAEQTQVRTDSRRCRVVTRTCVYHTGAGSTRRRPGVGFAKRSLMDTLLLLAKPLPSQATVAGATDRKPRSSPTEAERPCEQKRNVHQPRTKLFLKARRAEARRLRTLLQAKAKCPSSPDKTFVHTNLAARARWARRPFAHGSGALRRVILRKPKRIRRIRRHFRCGSGALGPVILRESKRIRRIRRHFRCGSDHGSGRIRRQHKLLFCEGNFIPTPIYNTNRRWDRIRRRIHRPRTPGILVGF